MTTWNTFTVHKLKLAVLDGSQFGENGAGFLRLNLGTQRSGVKTAMGRIGEAGSREQLEAALGTGLRVVRPASKGKLIDQMLQSADTTGGDHRDRDSAGERRRRLDIRALHGAVAVDVGVDDRGHARVLELAGQIGGLDGGFLGPATGCDHALARIHAHGHAAGKGAGRFAHQIGVFHGDRAEDRLDNKGDRIDRRLDRKSDRADAAGRDRLSDRLDRKGDQVDRRMDRRGENIDRRLDRRGAQIDRRLDRRGKRVNNRI